MSEEQILLCIFMHFKNKHMPQVVKLKLRRFDKKVVKKSNSRGDLEVLRKHFKIKENWRVLRRRGNPVTRPHTHAKIYSNFKELTCAKV